MGKALHAELQKARRHHDLLICLAVPVVVYLWAGAAAPTGADELANAYSALLFALPVLNAILMPIVMALIASRLWDMEVKGSTTKLLYTLQSRRSLFAGKALLGTGEVLLMVTLEMAVSILLAGAGLHRGVSCRAVCVHGHLHAGCRCHAVFLGASADVDF